MLKIACILPTYNGVECLGQLLQSLKIQSVPFDLIIVDSSSTDGTAEISQAATNKFITIPSMHFNHGGTRQLVVNNNPDYDIYIFLTQDVILESPHSFSSLIRYFDDAQVGAVCGRQLPHYHATELAKHARYFNYPSESCVKSFVDIQTLGIKAAFISNSFSAYRASALRDVGGFPAHVIFAEDMYVASKMLLAGWKVAYAGDAQCRHSHDYSIANEFSRYFDMGVFHAREPWIRGHFGGAGREGLRYVKSELKFLGWKLIMFWPEVILRNAAKLIGYKLGQQEARLPVSVKRKLGMYKRYWDGEFANDHKHCPIS